MIVSNFSGIINVHLEPHEVDELLPCPFCGDKPEDVLNTHTPYYWVECAGCGCEVSAQIAEELGYDSEADHLASAADAVRRWNMRVNFDSLGEDDAAHQ